MTGSSCSRGALSREVRNILGEPRRTIQIADREIAIHAAKTSDKRLRDNVDRAYLDQYIFLRPSITEGPYATDLPTPGFLVDSAVTSADSTTTSILDPISPKRASRIGAVACVLLVSWRYQVIHSQVLHHLSVMIPGVRQENVRCIESCGPELIGVRICDLL